MGKLGRHSAGGARSFYIWHSGITRRSLFFFPGGLGHVGVMRIELRLLVEERLCKQRDIILSIVY